jgi:1,4-dihydroxy-6-naphthoate synthase
MRIAYSPCPNDTFTFHALVHGLIPGVPKLDVTYADINITNTWALEDGAPEIMKISYAALPWVLKDYALLPCGGALGRGCGPLILTKGATGNLAESSGNNSVAGSSNNHLINLPDPSTLTGKRIAVPSERSTAYLLFRLWAAQQVPGGVGEIVIMPFDQIMPAVRDGLIDAGLVIHEARFTYQNYGLSLMADLGSWWEADTGLPIPLGAIIARRTLDLPAITSWIRSSVEYAWAHPEASREYVLEHSQEMDPQVAKAHIDLYVNEFTANLGDDGYNAVYALLSRASDEGIVPKVNQTDLR